MSLYEQIYPSPESVVEMEPEELAPLVLKHLSEGGSQQLNMHNFTTGTSHDFIKWAGEDHNYRKKVLQSLIVAWRWLEKELFIAPQPGQVDWAFITPRGKAILESQDFKTYTKGNLLPSEGLDPILVRKVKSAFIRGDYDTAVFQAFKEVEVRVRNKAKLPNSELGVQLMTKAFGPPSGALVDSEATGGEQTAMMQLFAGAVGTFKNPSSHRDVEFSNPKEAADIIHFANHLLRIVGNIEI